MRVILTEDIAKLGNAGEVVKVRDGYARNYLMPRGKAELATEARVKELEHKKRVIEEKTRKLVKEHEKVALQIHKLPALTFIMLAGEEGKLFGSVTNSDIQQKLAEAGVEVDRRKIELSEPIKQIGEHKVHVRLHREVKTELRVLVVAEATPAAPEAEQAEAAE